MMSITPSPTGPRLTGSCSLSRAVITRLRGTPFALLIEALERGGRLSPINILMTIDADHAATTTIRNRRRASRVERHITCTIRLEANVAIDRPSLSRTNTNEFLLGQDAAVAGLSPFCNPYPPDSESWHDFNDGHSLGVSALPPEDDHVQCYHDPA